MKNCLLLLFSFILFTNINAQVAENDLGCKDKPHHITDFSRGGQANYTQFVSSMDKYDVKYLKLDIDAEPTSRFITGTAYTVTQATMVLDTFVCELMSNIVLDSVFINGSKLGFTRNLDHVFIPISPALPAGSFANVLFYYNGTANSGAVFAGTNGSGLTYSASLSESYQAREWFPVKQILSDKIDSADIWITTGLAFKAGSNGLLQAIVPKQGGKVQYQWKTRYPMNYYLPSFSVANYQEYDNYAHPAAMAPDSILIQHYIQNDATVLASIKANLDKTPAFVETFSTLFGLYPFSAEKYGHSQASIGGGMEHQTMTTTSSFNSTIIAHELGHQWFGDNVTCLTWNDIWLNEGFASYCEYLAIENLPLLFTTTNPATYMQNIHNDVLSSTNGSVRVPDASVFDENRIFSSRFSYNKGSAIIHTLRFEMQNDNTFFQTLKNYQSQYKNNVASAEDFKLVAETTSGKNFDDFFAEWYYGEGYPTFNVTYLKQGANILTLIVNQTVSDAAVTPFFKGLYEFTITSAQGDTTVKVYMTSNNQHFDFYNYSKTPNGVIVDPNNWVLNKVGTITNGGIIIPVRIQSFTGKTDANCNTLLTWNVSNEQNIQRYDIEYSADAVHFVKVGERTGKNLSVSSIYTFINSFAEGKQFYRLKVVELDGSFTYSEQISVNNTCKPNLTVDVTPNPVPGNLWLTVVIPQTQELNIKVMNELGETLFLGKRKLTAGTNLFELKELNNLHAGTYLLQVENATGTVLTKKFSKG